MLITFSGLHGTGKTTVAKLVAEKLGLSHVSTGMVFREMAEARHMSLVDFSEYAAQHREIDLQLDEKMRNTGLKGNVVLDGQLCWHFLEKEAGWKVLLVCDEATRIRRIYDRDKERKGMDFTLDDAAHETQERERIEQARYKKIYGVDLSDVDYVKTKHDLVVDTTRLSIMEVVDVVVSTVRK